MLPACSFRGRAGSNRSGGHVEPEAVVQRVEREIANYQSQRPARLGGGRSADRIRAELAALSRALVPPVRGKFAVRDEGVQLTTPEPELTTYWVVAQDPDGTVVFYDEADDEFGLGEATPDGDLETVGVRGDLLSVFLAR
jgi:hypothetical protein